MEGEKGMKKSLLFATVLIGISAIGYSDSKSKSLGTSKLESSLEAIENRFANLMEREEAQRQQYRSEKAKLESEIEELKAAGAPVLHYYSMGKSDNIVKVISEVF